MRMKPKFTLFTTRTAQGLWGIALSVLLIGIAVLWSFRPSIDALPSQARMADLMPSDFLPPELAFRVRFQEKLGQVDLLLDIAPGYALYAERLKVVVEKGNAQLGSLRLPVAQVKWDANLQKNVQIYRQKQTIAIPISFPVRDANRASEWPRVKPFVLAVTLQGCADTGLCYAPITYRQRITNTTITPPVLPPPSSTLHAAWSGLTDSQAALTALHKLDAKRNAPEWLYGLTPLAFFALFFFFGVALSVLPCSWPMIPIVSALILQANAHSEQRCFVLSKDEPPSQKPPATFSWRRGLRLSLLYVLGMASTYALFGVIAALAGQRFGASMGHPWVQASFAAVIFVMAIMLLRGRGFAFSLIRRVAPSLSLSAQGRSSLAFIMGALSALTLSPCMSPPLFGVLAFIGQTGHIGIGALALFALGMGLGLPLIAMGVGLSAYLPRSGAWMRYVQQAIAIVLLGVALYLALPAGITLLHAAGWQQKASTLPDGAGPLASNADLVFHPVHTRDELNAAVRSSQKISMLKVYADNCSACSKIERVTLAATEVRAHLQAFNILRLNVSMNTPAIAELLKHFGLYGPPAFLFFDANGNEITALRRVGYISPEALLQILEPLLEL